MQRSEGSEEMESPGSGNIRHPGRGRKYAPHTDCAPRPSLRNPAMAGPDREMGTSSNLGFPKEDHIITGKAGQGL